MITLKLKNPVKQGSEMISEITFREPKARDLWNQKFSYNTYSELLEIATKTSDQLPEVIKELSVKDTHQVIEVIANFLRAGLET